MPFKQETSTFCPKLPQIILKKTVWLVHISSRQLQFFLILSINNYKKCSPDALQRRKILNKFVTIFEIDAGGSQIQ